MSLLTAGWLPAALLALGAGAEPCPWQDDYVSATPAPLPLAEHDVIDEIDERWSINEVLIVLGPAARDVGSGLHVLEWDVDDGRTLRVAAVDACSKPQSVGFVAPRPPPDQEPQ